MAFVLDLELFQILTPHQPSLSVSCNVRGEEQNPEGSQRAADDERFSVYAAATARLRCALAKAGPPDGGGNLYPDKKQYAGDFDRNRL